MPTFVAFLFCSLARLQDDPARQAQELIQKLGAESFEERNEASRGLRTLGEGALPLLQEALKSPELEVRNRAAAVIGHIRWGPRMSPRLEEAAAPVFVLLGSPESARRGEGIKELAKVVSDTHSRDGQIYRWLLHDPAYSVASAAYRHLSWRGADRLLIDGILALVASATVTDVEPDGGKTLSAILDRLMDVMTVEDLPRLAPLLGSEKEPGKLCAESLAHALGDKAVGDRLLETLGNTDWKARIALHGLSRVPLPKASDVLRKIRDKKDAPADLQALAALSLVKLGDRLNADELVGWALGKDDELAAVAMRTLGALRDEESVKKVLGSHKRGGPLNDKRYGAALRMARELDTPAGYEALFISISEDHFLGQHLMFESGSTRNHILAALFPHWAGAGRRDLRLTCLDTEYDYCRSRELIDLAVKTLADPSRPREHWMAFRVLYRPLTIEQERVAKAYIIEQGKKDLSRAIALNGKHYIALPELVPVARERLQSGCDPHSLKILARWGDTSDIPLIRQKLKGSDGKLKDDILYALAHLRDPQVADDLIERMKDPKTVQAAATQLEYVWSKELAERLKGLLQDESYRAAWGWILQAFDSAGDRSLIPSYRFLLREQDEDLRSGAARMAGEWQDQGAKGDLKELMQDAEIRVKIQALRSLALLGEASVEPEILTQCASEEEFVVGECIEALEALKSPRAIQMLLRLAQTEGDYQYGQALGALVQAGAKEALGPARVILDAGRVPTLNQEGALRTIQRLGEPRDAELVYGLALEGNAAALRALDAVVYRDRYRKATGIRKWKEQTKLDHAAANVAEAYGIRISLSEGLEASLPLRTPPPLLRKQDFYGAIELLTHSIMECVPIYDGEFLRLVTVSEAIEFWKVHRPGK